MSQSKESPYCVRFRGENLLIYAESAMEAVDAAWNQIRDRHGISQSDFRLEAEVRIAERY
jgi:hypothetical protein